MTRSTEGEHVFGVGIERRAPPIFNRPVAELPVQVAIASRGLEPAPKHDDYLSIRGALDAIVERGVDVAGWKRADTDCGRRR